MTRAVLLAAALLVAAGCETHRWRTHPTAELLGRERPPARTLLVTGEDGGRLLEGARLAEDSVVGFQELEDGSWHRVSAPVDRATLQLYERDWTRMFLVGLLPSAALLVGSAASR